MSGVAVAKPMPGYPDPVCCQSLSLTLPMIHSPSAFANAINAALISSTQFTALPPASLIGRWGPDAAIVTLLFVSKSHSAALVYKETLLFIASFGFLPPSANRREDQSEDESSDVTCIPGQPRGFSYQCNQWPQKLNL